MHLLKRVSAHYSKKITQFVFLPNLTLQNTIFLHSQRICSTILPKPAIDQLHPAWEMKQYHDAPQCFRVSSTVKSTRFVCLLVVSCRTLLIVLLFSSFARTIASRLVQTIFTDALQRLVPECSGKILYTVPRGAKLLFTTQLACYDRSLRVIQEFSSCTVRFRLCPFVYAGCFAHWKRLEIVVKISCKQENISAEKLTQILCSSINRIFSHPLETEL